MTAFACLALIVGCFWLMIFIQYKISQGHSERIKELEDRVDELAYLEQERRDEWDCYG